MDDLIQFQHFKETGLVSHCYSTRLGGVSNGVFKSMNLGFSRGDVDEHVLENYKRLAKKLGLTINDLVLSNQIHDSQLREVFFKDKGKGLTQKSDIIGIDGLLTREAAIGLTCFFADCVPLFFLDPVRKAIAISHAGWRGTILNIGAETIAKMQTLYHSNVEDILVGIGPSIGPCCYEVSEDVKKEFAMCFNDDIIAKIVIKEYQDDQGNNKYKLDLWEANRILLLQIGVLDKNIELSGLCTGCHQEHFFSHRKMGAERGSQVGIIALN